MPSILELEAKVCSAAMPTGAHTASLILLHFYPACPPLWNSRQRLVGAQGGVLTRRRPDPACLASKWWLHERSKQESKGEVLNKGRESVGGRNHVPTLETSKAAAKGPHYRRWGRAEAPTHPPLCISHPGKLYLFTCHLTLFSVWLASACYFDFNWFGKL